MKAPAGSVMTVGFGTAVAMWFVGYVGRLPGLLLPGQFLLAAMLAVGLGGGYLFGRHAAGGPRVAALAGALTGVLNLLILGSFLGGDRPGMVVPSAAIWIPGSILLSAALAWAGARVGARRPAPYGNWDGAFVKVAVAATMLLLAAGGIVTSAEAGLAVDDWPTSFGYNMFLYPFSQMTGGIYLEHAHRLVGALVGLTTVAMAILLTRTEPRRWVRTLAWAAVGLVVVQGILGGIRVTERSLALAMSHGILAQLFFSILVALAAFTAGGWRSNEPATERRGVRGDRVFSAVLVALIVLQLVLGAAQRHFQEVLLLHILFGLAVVAPIGIHVGFRTWGANPEHARLRRFGLALAGLLGAQLLLGFGAYMATRGAAAGTLPPVADVVVATLHQWTGAVILAVAVSVTCWNQRLIQPEPAPGGEPASAAR